MAKTINQQSIQNATVRNFTSSSQPFFTQIQIDEDIQLLIIEPSNANELYQIIDVNREYFGQYMDWVRFNQSTEDVSSFINNAIINYDSNKEYTFTIQTNAIIIDTFTIRNKGNSEVEIGYWLDPAYSGRGIITKTLNRVSKILLEQMNIVSIYVKCAVFNTKSNMVPQRAGFTHVGVLENAEPVNGRFYDQNVYVLRR